MQITERYKKFFSGLLSYTSRLVDIAVENNKKIAIWGYWKCGRFIKHLIEDYDRRTKVDYIIDEKIENLSESPVIYRSSVLNYVPAADILLLSTIKNVQEIERIAEEYGYKRGENFFDVYSDVGESYIAYMQKENPNLDFGDLLEREERVYGTENQQHTPFSFSAVDALFSEIAGLGENLAFFDFGCGKGTAIIYAYIYGIEKLGGVELVEKVYTSAITNLEELGIKADLVKGNAMECSIDQYNCFFFYNPFRGETFEKVIGKIEESVRNFPRDIYLVYGNPFEHKAVVKHGFFELYKQIRVDLYDPILNIYKISKGTAEKVYR